MFYVRHNSYSKKKKKKKKIQALFVLHMIDTVLSSE